MTIGEYIQKAVTPSWIKTNMNDLGVRVKDICAEAGLNKTNVSAWINGKRPMSKAVKAFFFYYFCRKAAGDIYIKSK